MGRECQTKAESAVLAPPALSASKQLQLAVVQLLHIVIILYLLFTPFLARSAAGLIIYLLFVFAVVMHWVANHHFCVLSMLEAKIRGIHFEDGFINAVLKPIFGFGVNNTAAYIIIVVLFGIAMYRLIEMSRHSQKRIRRLLRHMKQKKRRRCVNVPTETPP